MDSYFLLRAGCHPCQLQEDIHTDITIEMQQFWQQRTAAHIARVKKYAAKINDFNPMQFQGLMQQVSTHDDSKWVDPERTPYIWITWKYKKEKDGEKIDLPEEIKAQMNAATEHHIKVNKHHPEYHTTQVSSLINPNDRDAVPEKSIDATAMDKVSIAEMVADWLAMAEELGTAVDQWAKKTINKRWQFTTEQVDLIYDILANVKVE